jgi:hypothetical protein
MNTLEIFPRLHAQNSWHYLSTVEWGEREMAKAKRVIPAVCGLTGLVVGSVAAYFILSNLWTQLIVQPADVTASDLYIVLTLSLIAGVGTGLLALFASAQRYWSPQNRILQRPVS